MPTPIIFTITTAGRLAALDAFDNGLTIALTQCAFGSGKYTPTGSETALNTELGRVGLSGGAIESVSATLRFSAALIALTHINAFEIGLFSSTGVLFAVASTTSTTIPLTVVEPNIDTICAFGLVLGDVPASSLTITLDPNAPLAIQLVTQHAAAANPHPQYKRRLDNTERMKVAAAVDEDEAIRKDTLDALRVRLIANGIDADLGTTNPISNLDSFVAVGEGYYADTTTGTKPSSYGVAKTWRVNSTFIHQLAQTTDGKIAGRYSDNNGSSWYGWRIAASENGDESRIFNAANGIAEKNVINKGQLDLALGSKANKTGDNTQVFKVAAAAANEDAIRLDQLTSMGGAIKIAILQMIYQVGQPYFNKADARNPNDIFGVTVGTWAQEKGRFLVGLDNTQEEFDLLADTGGAKSHVMTAGNLIAHNHTSPSSAGLGTSSGGVDTVQQSSGSEDTSTTGSATPDPIPTLPPYVVYSWWVRTA